MELRKISLCFISVNKETIGRLRTCLQTDLQIFSVPDVKKAISLLHSRVIDCILVGLSENGSVTPAKLSVLTIQFSTIPIVGVIEQSFSDKNISFDLVCGCGRIGIKHVVFTGKTETLAKTIQLVLSEKNLRRGDFGININECSSRVRKAVAIIKSNYPELQFARDVAKILGVTSATISREFNRQLGVGIIQLIRFYKIRHAVALMENPAMNLNEIADLTGFANRTTFYRCFQQLTGQSPREYRRLKQSVDFERIFWEKIKKSQTDQKL